MSDINILVVEDDENLLNVISYNLRQEGYKVAQVSCGDKALEIARTFRPDMMILDIMLPGLNGIEICRIMRKEIAVPIIMLTAVADERDKLLAFEVGADDYVTKPFAIRELLARVRAQLRRSNISNSTLRLNNTIYKINNLEIHSGNRQVLLDGKVLNLSPKEFDLLIFLAENKGNVLSRDQLLEHVWGYSYAGGTRTVDVHIRWLREKIEMNPARPELLITVRGGGYKLQDKEDE